MDQNTVNSLAGAKSETQTLCEFLAGLRYEQIPLDVVARTEDFFLDWLGSGLAGKGSRPVLVLEQFAKAMGPATGPSEILTTRGRTSPFFAALINGAASHVVGRRLSSRFRGEVLFVMNAQFLGPYDIAPRGHPNDGRVEVLKVASSMSWRVRRRALQRALTGTHVPHPLISTSVVSTSPLEVVFERPLDVWLDGTKWLRTRSVTFTVEADALEVFA